MDSYQRDRRIIRTWMKKNRMPNTSDYAVENFTFLKNAEYDYLLGDKRYFDHKAGFMVVADQLISVSFPSDYRYNPYVIDWFAAQTSFTSFFDESWIVATTENFDKVYEKTDKKIGIMIIDTNGCFAVVRQAVARRGRQMNHYALAGLLTKPAMVDLYEKNGDKQSLAQTKEMLRRHAQCVPYEKLRSAVTTHLKYKYHNRQPLPF